MLRAHRMDALSADINRNLQGMAAGFGTAQQQASKQAALRGGGGVGDSLAALTRHPRRCRTPTINDNEHARFMANAHSSPRPCRSRLAGPCPIKKPRPL